MAAGESMHSIARQGHIRRVDNSKASGNRGFVFINWFRRRRLILTRSASVSLSYKTALLSSGLKDKYVDECCYHFSLKHPVPGKYLQESLFLHLSGCHLLLELRGWMFFKVEGGESRLATLISENNWLADIASNQRQSQDLIDDDRSPVMVKSWWKRV